MLRPFTHAHTDAYSELVREMRRFERSMDSLLGMGGMSMAPYWNNPVNFGNLNAARELGEVTNDSSRFGVRLDVSHFRPEQLRVHLDGRLLTIEGEQEDKTEHGYSKRSFTRRFSLPEDCDLSAVRSQLSTEGHLSIEAPKKAANQGRAIPIEHGGSSGGTQAIGHGSKPTNEGRAASDKK